MEPSCVSKTYLRKFASHELSGRWNQVRLCSLKKNVVSSQVTALNFWSSFNFSCGICIFYNKLNKKITSEVVSGRSFISGGIKSIVFCSSSIAKVQVLWSKKWGSIKKRKLTRQGNLFLSVCNYFLNFDCNLRRVEEWN